MRSCLSCQSLLPDEAPLARCPACTTLNFPADGAPSEPSARLVHRGLAGQVVEYPLVLGTVTLGRSTSASIQLADREVSRRHTQLELQGDTYVLSDLGSSNGTFLNGRRLVEKTPLKDGDEIILGTTRLTFRTKAPRQTIILSDEKSPVLAAVGSDRAFLPAEQISDVRALRRDYERLRIAHEFQRFIRLERDLGSLLTKILDIAFELIPAQNGVILLRSEKNGALVVEAVRQRAGPGAEVLISDTLLAHVTNTREGVLTSDALGDARFSASDSIVGLGVRSCMAVPLLSAGEVRGVMFFDSRERIGAFTPKDLDVLSAIASQATVAIENNEMARTIEQSAEKRAFLERFLSPQLASEVARGNIELTKGGTLTELTVLFSDIRSFTSMSEENAPQDTVAMLNEYFELMADCVFAYDGIVDKFIGDAIMALFGAPVRGVDDAERALRCALLMQQKTLEFNELRKAQGKVPISVGIGLHTGEAVVGVIGSTKRLEYTAIGDTVNIASRLCDAAEGQTIVLSEDCLRRAGPQQFVAQEQPQMQVKGRTGSLKTFVIRC